jgi:hypothetical protein
MAAFIRRVIKLTREITELQTTYNWRWSEELRAPTGIPIRSLKGHNPKG